MKLLSIVFSFFCAARVAVLAQPVLSLGSAVAWQGGSAALDVRLAGGASPYAGFNATIILPQGFQVSGVANGSLLPPGGFAVDEQVSTPSGANLLSVVAYSPTNTFTGSGTLLSLLLKIPSGAPLGNNIISFKEDTNALVSPHALSSFDGSQSVAHTTVSGNVEVFSPTADTDGDGYSDQMEICFGTNPRDASSKPRPSLIRGTNGLAFAFPTSSNPAFTYRVVYSDNLFLPLNSWTVLTDNIPGNGATITITNISATAQQRFYRVAATLAP